MPKRTETTDRRLLILPVVTGCTHDFAGVVNRLRDFLRFRSAPAGPWLYEPAEHGGQSLWDWVADSGRGISCEDLGVLQSFVEIVLAHDPLTGRAVAVPWCPGARGMLSTSRVILNQALSFVVAHLENPGEYALVRYGTAEDDGTVSLRVPNDGGGASCEFDLLGMIAAMEAGGEGVEEPEMFLAVKAPDDNEWVRDWLEPLLDEEYDGRGGEVSAEELEQRLERLRERLVGDAAEPPGVRLAFEALYTRVVERTNALRERYARIESTWPRLASLRPTVPIANVQFAVNPPEYLRELSGVSCAVCEGCDRTPDLRPAPDQLRLPI